MRIFLVCLITTMATASSVAAQDVERLGWLSGCWEGVRGERTFEEQWMLPRGGMMLGMSRTSVRDSIVDFESVAIVSRGGRTFYRARPEGQAQAEFDLKQLSDSTVTFENLAHDFPQRISYNRVRGDSLLAYIEGTTNGNTRRVDFPMRAVPCPASRTRL